MIEYWNELSTGQKTKLILKIVVGILALLFAVQNWQSVSFSLVFFRFNIPGTVLILICIGIGFGLASIFDYKKFKVKNKEITELKSKLLSPVDEFELDNIIDEANKNMEHKRKAIADLSTSTDPDKQVKNTKMKAKYLKSIAKSQKLIAKAEAKKA